MFVMMFLSVRMLCIVLVLLVVFVNVIVDVVVSVLVIMHVVIVMSVAVIVLSLVFVESLVSVKMIVLVDMVVAVADDIINITSVEEMVLKLIVNYLLLSFFDFLYLSLLRFRSSEFRLLWSYRSRFCFLSKCRRRRWKALGFGFLYNPLRRKGFVFLSRHGRSSWFLFWRRFSSW